MTEDRHKDQRQQISDTLRSLGNDLELWAMLRFANEEQRDKFINEAKELALKAEQLSQSETVLRIRRSLVSITHSLEDLTHRGFDRALDWEKYLDSLLQYQEEFDELAIEVLFDGETETAQASADRDADKRNKFLPDVKIDSGRFEVARVSPRVSFKT